MSKTQTVTLTLALKLHVVKWWHLEDWLCIWLFWS